MMSTPPFGVGYPDGSSMISAWGPKLYDEQTQVHANGAVIIPRTFVGSWKFLSCHLILGGANAAEIDFTWDAQNVFAFGTGAADIHLSPADTSEIFVTIPNLGPYVTASITVTGGGNATLSGSIVPCDNLIGASGGISGGQVWFSSATVAAGGAIALPLTTISPRRGTVSILSNLGLARAFVDSTDRSGSFRNRQGADMSTPAGIAGAATAQIVLPAMRTALNATNLHTAAQNMYVSLVTDPG